MMVGEMNNMLLELPPIHSDLAVVPIFVNAGAALFPALAAGFATFFSLLFKPKELFKFCSEKPLIPSLVLLIGVAIYSIITYWPQPEASQASSRRGLNAQITHQPNTNIDWTKIALARIKARELGQLKETPKVAPIIKVDDQPYQEPVIYRGGSERTGWNGSSPEGKLTLSWDYYPSWVDDDGTVEVDEQAMILSSPAVYDGIVYAASCVLDPPDSYGIVFGVDIQTGETTWSIDQVEGEDLKGFFSSPAITADGKYLIIGQGLHPDTNCRLICINRKTGEVHWTVQTPLHLESSPAIENGVVYIGAGAIEDPATHKPISHTGYVMAVNIEDGKELWRYDVADPESSPIVHNGTLYIGSGFNGQAIVALRTATDEDLKKSGQSRLLWKTEAPYPITGAVTKVGDTVFVGGGNGDFVFRDPNPAGIVMALEAKTGIVKWKSIMPDAVLGAVAADKYLICPVASGKVIALDPNNGNKIWETHISGKAPVLAGAAVGQGWIYAVSHDGYMAKLNLKDGSLVEKVYINSKTMPGEQGLSISSPFVIDGRIIVGSETGGLRSYVGTSR